MLIRGTPYLLIMTLRKDQKRQRLKKLPPSPLRQSKFLRMLTLTQISGITKRIEFLIH